MPGKNIVILGGGFGGAAAARTLRKLLDAEHTVTLVDRLRRTYLGGSMPWLIVGQRQTDQISRSLGALIQRGVNYIQADVEVVDIANHRVQTNVSTLPYDYLILATGAEYDWDAVPGSSKEHSFYDIESAHRLRGALKHIRHGRIVIAIGRLPYKCPPAPYEAAMLLDRVFTDRGTRNQIDLHVFTPEALPLGITGPTGSDTLKAQLEKRRIVIHTGENLSHVAPDARRATFLSGESIDYDLLITVPVHRSPMHVREAGLTDGSGWVPVDQTTLATKQDDIYAVGDITFLPMANGAPLPKSGVFASAEGEVVARNLAARIQHGPWTAFTGNGFCFLDHGSGKGSLIGGEFMAPDGPQVTLASPSVRWYRQKLRFERDWHRWKI